MSRKTIFLLSGLLLALAAALLVVGCAQPTEEATEATEEATEEAAASVPMSDIEPVLIRTSSTHVVGIGSYVAAEPYAIAAGEDPAAQPAQAFIMPYAIYPNMGIANIEDFDPANYSYNIGVPEGFTYEWSLTAPEGSAATLIEADDVAIFMADVAGEFVLTLNITDPNGNTATNDWAIHTGTYIGVGTLTGAEPEIPNCGACHADRAEAWSETAHASMFTRSIDGETSEHYNANCIECHTTGFNNRPEANNGGFDDVATEAGWEFPGALAAGNWDAMVADYPEVAGLANIQCEACHGPGSAHFTGDPTNMGPINRGLEYGTCAQCHGEEPYHVFPQQWELSAHADRDARAFWYPTGEEHAACVGCHTGGGYIDRVAGLPAEERRTDYQPITCGVCHDPHNLDAPNQLRVYDTVTLPNGTEITDAGPAATCMSCHNTRVDAVALVEGERFGTPHYSAAAELLNGTGGYTWGESLPSSPHGTMVENTCVTCHMAETPGMDDNGTPDDATDDTPLPGHNTVGGHTFDTVSPVDGTENVAVCQTCHGEEMTSFEFAAGGDYDGNGTVGTNEEEIAGLLALLQTELEARGVTILPSYPYMQLPDGASVDIRGAAFNFKLIRDNANPAHNRDYIVALLQLSYERLTGSEVPNADTP